MGKKIFVSYKYADDQVQNLTSDTTSTVRDYIDEFEKKIDSSDHIFKGESNVFAIVNDDDEIELLVIGTEDNEIRAAADTDNAVLLPR